MTCHSEDRGGIAICNRPLTSGVHYWEVQIDALWDTVASDGSLRVGLAMSNPEELVKSDLGLGDDQSTIGWWDCTVDGAVFQEWEGPSMKEGDRLGIMVDLDNFLMELYVEKQFITELQLPPDSTYYPAFYTRTHFDRLTLIDNPTLPAALSV